MFLQVWDVFASHIYICIKFQVITRQLQQIEESYPLYQHPLYNEEKLYNNLEAEVLIPQRHQWRFNIVYASRMYNLTNFLNILIISTKKSLNMKILRDNKNRSL